jgi:hypothetical protein
MANTCLVTKLQGTVSGDNLIKFGTLKLLISRKYLTLSDSYTTLNIRYRNVASGVTPTAKFDIDTVFNEVEYPAGTEIQLNPAYGSTSNQVKFKISDIPADGCYAYITNKYNLDTLGGVSNYNCNCLMSALELSYLSQIDTAVGIAIEGGSIAEMDCPNMTKTGCLKQLSGSLADYPYPTKIKNLTILTTSGVTVVANDLLGFTNLESFPSVNATNVSMDTAGMISVFSTLTKFNTFDTRGSGVTCDADTFALGLKNAGVVSRTIVITMQSKQWAGGSGTSQVKKTFVFDANGDYTITTA